MSDLCNFSVWIEHMTYYWVLLVISLSWAISLSSCTCSQYYHCYNKLYLQICTILGLICTILGLIWTILGLICTILGLIWIILGLIWIILGLICTILGLICTILGSQIWTGKTYTGKSKTLNPIGIMRSIKGPLTSL